MSMTADGVEPFYYPSETSHLLSSRQAPRPNTPWNRPTHTEESLPPYSLLPTANDHIKWHGEPKHGRIFGWNRWIIVTVVIVSSLVGFLYSLYGFPTLAPEERKSYRNSGIYWGAARPLDCLEGVYHKREYSAQLQNFSHDEGFDISKACQFLDIEIKTRFYESPNRCRQQGQHMYGYWDVYDQQDCTVYDEIQKYRSSGIYWGAAQPLNCLETYHNREYNAQLMNFSHEEGLDINKACQYLDIEIQSHPYESPRNCRQQGQHMYGFWTVYDQKDCTVYDEIRKYRNSGMSWDTPLPAFHCHSYDKREYRAELINIPRGYDWDKACIYIPVKIQGQTYEKPDLCERRESSQYGKWVANNQLDCRPYWGPLQDVGCQASGKKRFEATLWNLMEGDDWYGMCASTPAKWLDKDYEHPTYCVYRHERMVGIWDVEDCTIDDEIQRYRNSGMSWDTPIPAPHCYSYDKREYNSKLINIPRGYDWDKACRYIPVKIQDQIIEQPDVCDHRITGQYGKWFAGNQMDCRPYWGPLRDMGCQASGKKRLEAPLWNLIEGDDWYGMCANTPARWHDKDYEHPSYCDYRKREGAMIGIWDVEGCFVS